MKKLLIPTLMMSAFAASNAMAAGGATVNFSGNVTISDTGVNWYASGTEAVPFLDHTVVKGTDVDGFYTFQPEFADTDGTTSTAQHDIVAMMTTNSIKAHTSSLDSIPFKPTVTVKVGDESVQFDPSTGKSTNAVTATLTNGTKITWAAGDILSGEAGTIITKYTFKNQPDKAPWFLFNMISSLLNAGWHTNTWAQDVVMKIDKQALTKFNLASKAFGDIEAGAMGANFNNYSVDWWNTSAPKLGDATVGYDFKKIDKAVFSHINGERDDVEMQEYYSAQRVFAVDQPTVSVPKSAFDKNTNAPYSTTMTITVSAS